MQLKVILPVSAALNVCSNNPSHSFYFLPLLQHDFCKKRISPSLSLSRNRFSLPGDIAKNSPFYVDASRSSFCLHYKSVLPLSISSLAQFTPKHFKRQKRGRLLGAEIQLTESSCFFSQPRRGFFSVLSSGLPQALSP